MLRSYLAVLMLTSLFLSLAMTLSISVNARSKAEMRDACRDDFLRHCTNVQRGGGRILQCLQSHMSELAPACREVVEERLAAKQQEKRQ